MNLSVIIPVYNMGSHLPDLWDSIRRGGLLKMCSEVIFVDDGSVDGTADRAERLPSTTDEKRKVRVLRMPENRGRFWARKAGAEAAAQTNLLFLDARVVLPDQFAEMLERRSADHQAVQIQARVDGSSSIYSLYWKRSHDWLYRNHYREAAVPVVLTPANFDRFLVGTTAFYCDRRLFLDSVDSFGDQSPLNDDLPLLRKIVECSPIAVFPDLWVGWKPREELVGFLARIRSRGPSFAEYHLFTRRGPFFYACLCIALGAALVMTAFAAHPATGIGLIAALAFAASAISAILMSCSVTEFIKILPLHLCVLSVFSVGVLEGIAVNLTRHKEERG